MSITEAVQPRRRRTRDNWNCEDWRLQCVCVEGVSKSFAEQVHDIAALSGDATLRQLACEFLEVLKVMK